MNRKLVGIFQCAMPIVWGVLAAPVIAVESAPFSDAEQVQSVHVLRRVELLQQELEQLRRFMGRPRETRPLVTVEGAHPREVLFQALTLFRKADRLCFEITRTRAPQPTAPATDITLTDVKRVVDEALGRIRLTNRELDIEPPVEAEPLNFSTTTSDIFAAIVQANRQLNLMLEQQFAPCDVFQQVTKAIAYSERLLELFPGGDSVIPAAPELERNKTPSQVYRRLLKCFATIRRISQTSGENVLTFDELENAPTAVISPSDVYDVASLVVSELAYLHSLRADTRPPRSVYYPGRKFPSQVFQRVGILEKQLQQLEKWVEAHPDWAADSPPRME